MASNAKWQDEYWLLLLQVYLEQPVGVKPMYSPKMVEVSLELHIPPERLYGKMCQLARLDTPRIERIWNTYRHEPHKLERAVRLLREMNGFSLADSFYDGVTVNESFERDFRPVAGSEHITPVMLILILDLYFRLTPQTMMATTPEIQELAMLMKIEPQEVADMMNLFQHCDPYLKRRGMVFHPFLLPCQDIWRRFGNGDVVALAAYAEQLKDFFRD